MKVIVVSLSGIGNTLLFTPVLKNLKKTFPNSNVTVLVLDHTFGEVINGNPYVDEILTFENAKSIPARIKFVLSLRKRKFDVSITAFPSNRIEYNLLAFLIGAKKRITHSYSVGYLRTLAFLQNVRVPAVLGIHDVEQNLKLLRPLGITETWNSNPSTWLSDNDRQYADDFLVQHGIENRDLIIGIHPGSSKGMLSKRWPEERFAQVNDILYENYNVKIILFVGPDEIEIIYRIQRLAKSDPVIARDNTLKQTAAIIERCSLFIDTDSCLGHIAAAMGVPTITIFGPSNPKRTIPYGNKSVILQSDLLCVPCYRYPFYKTNSKIKCKTMDCLKEISVEDVLDAVDKQMRRRCR